MQPYYPGFIGGKHIGPGLVIRGQHRVTIQPTKAAARVWRPLADRVFATPLIAFCDNQEQEEHAPTARPAVAMGAPLPVSIEVVTLKTFGASGNTLLLRLAHQFGINEDAVLSQPVSVDIVQLFKGSIAIKGVKEVSLTANQDKAAIIKRREMALKWSNDSPRQHVWRRVPPAGTGGNTTVVLGPLEIKTFILEV